MHMPKLQSTWLRIYQYILLFVLLEGHNNNSENNNENNDFFTLCANSYAEGDPIQKKK